jgi:hypothetical protein
MALKRPPEMHGDAWERVPCSAVAKHTRAVTLTFVGDCSAGITSAQFRQIMENVLAGRAIPPELLERYGRFSQVFGVTEAVVTTFLRNLGESEVASEDLHGQMHELAGRHLTLLEQVRAERGCYSRPESY